MPKGLQEIAEAAEKLADAFGARGVRIEDGDPESLEKELSSSINIEAPTLIEVPVGEMPNPFRDY